MRARPAVLTVLPFGLAVAASFAAMSAQAQTVPAPDESAALARAPFVREHQDYAAGSLEVGPLDLRSDFHHEPKALATRPFIDGTQSEEFQTVFHASPRSRSDFEIFAAAMLRRYIARKREKEELELNRQGYHPRFLGDRPSEQRYTIGGKIRF